MIGVFDSGFGGLTVLRALLNKLPDYDYCYLGDNARAPYGNKSDELIYSYTIEALDFLFHQGAQLIIIACNTSSARALRKVQQNYLPSNYPDKKVLGVIIPVAEEALRHSRFGRVGVIGTKATISSQAYEVELKKQLDKKKNKNLFNFSQKDLNISVTACPLLVPLVEEGWLNNPLTKKIIRYYLRPLKRKKIDTLILGCTHYPLLLKDISGIMGKNVKIVNPAETVAEKLVDYLRRRGEIEKRLGKNKKLIFYATDDVGKFRELGRKFLGKEIGEVKKAVL